MRPRESHTNMATSTTSTITAALSARKLGTFINDQIIYYVNATPKFSPQSITPSGTFSVAKFDFELSCWSLSIGLLMEVAFKSLYGSRLVAFDYYKKATNVAASEITRRLFVIFPYEIPTHVVDKVASRFFQMFPIFDTLFEVFKLDLASRNDDFIDFLSKKIKNQFKIRSTFLKKSNLWLYREVDRRRQKALEVESLNSLEKLDKASLKKIYSEERIVELLSSFDYASMKTILEEKYQQEHKA